jgi:F-type H+-transporting ATPase subunit b
MEFLKVFGLETKLFLFQLINFLIIAGILAKFLYAPIKKMLDERKNKIEQSLRDAEEAKNALENAGEERKRILSEAKKDADALSVSTKALMQETKEKLTAEAKLQSQSIVEEAKQKAELEFENMSKQLGGISIDIAQKIMTKVFGDLFSEEDKQKLLSRAIEKIEKGGYEKISN